MTRAHRLCFDDLNLSIHTSLTSGSLFASGPKEEQSWELSVVLWVVHFCNDPAVSAQVKLYLA